MKISNRFYASLALTGLLLRELAQISQATWADLGAPAALHALPILWAAFLAPAAIVLAIHVQALAWRAVIGMGQEIVALWNAPLSTWTRLAAIGTLTGWLFKELLWLIGMPAHEAWRLSAIEVVLGGGVFLVAAGINRARDERRLASRHA